MRRVSRFVFMLGVALCAAPGLAFAKDSVTIGMVLEPPGLDPTSAGRGDWRSDAVQHLRGTDEDQRRLLGHAAAGRKVGLLARSQDPDLHPQAERQVSGRRAVHLQGRQIIVRALRGQGLDQQGQGIFRLDRFDRDARSDDCRAQVQGAELRGAVSSRHGTAVILDEKSAAGEATSPVGTGPYKLSLDQGLVADARQVGRLPRRGEDPADARHVPLHLRSLRRGRRDARRGRRCVPPLRQCRGARPVQERSALPGSGRRHRGQDDPRDEQQEEAARRSQGAAGDRLCDRPQGDHRRRHEWPRNADRQPSHPERSRLHRPHRDVSA